MGLKLVVAGSRDLKITPYILGGIINKEFSEEYIDEIVSGGAKGVDSCAETYAKEYSTHFLCIPADWGKHGRAAGPIRNKQMAEYGDALLAIWDGKSKGTKNMINEMKKLGKPVKVYLHDEGKFYGSS